MDSLEKTIRERKGFAEREGDSMILKSTVLKELGVVAQRVREETEGKHILSLGSVAEAKIAVIRDYEKLFTERMAYVNGFRNGYLYAKKEDLKALVGDSE